MSVMTIFRYPQKDLDYIVHGESFRKQASADTLGAGNLISSSKLKSKNPGRHLKIAIGILLSL